MRRYRIVKKLGDGSQGVAYLAIDTETRRDVVLKKIPAGNTNPDEMRLTTQAIKHPNIVSCENSFVENDFLYMVLAYCEGGDLESYLQLLQEEGQELPLSRACQWFAQLASALQYCHDSRTLHRDVKPSNVFLDKHLDNIFLGDFGVAKRLGGGGKEASTSTFVGSPVWLSPEVINGEAYSYASDAWGLGCVLYELVAGYSPFDTAGNLAALVMKIGAGEYEPLPSHIPDYVRRCVAGLLTVDPRRRWSIRQALSSCDEFRNAAFLVDVPAAPTPRGTYHPPYAALAAARRAGSAGASSSGVYGSSSGAEGNAPVGGAGSSLATNSTASAHPASPSAPVVVPSLSGARYGGGLTDASQPATSAAPISRPQHQPKGLNTWMRGMDDDFESLQKQLGKLGGGGGAQQSGPSSSPPVPTAAVVPAVGGPAGGQPPRPTPIQQQQPKGLNTWMRGMDDDFESLQKQLGKIGGGQPSAPSSSSAAPPQPKVPTSSAPSAGEPSGGQPPRPVQQQQQPKGLNTWMRGMDDDFESLQKQLGKIGGGGGGGLPLAPAPRAGNSPPPLPQVGAAAPASGRGGPPPPQQLSNKSPHVANSNVSGTTPQQPQQQQQPKGLNTWMRGMDDDLDSLQKQFGKMGLGAAGGGSGAAAFSSPPVGRPPAVGNNASPSPSAGAAPSRAPPAVSAGTTKSALPQKEPTATPKSGGSRLASPVVQRDAERGGGGARGFEVASPADDVDTRRWVKAKNAEIAEIEGILDAFRKRNGGGANNNNNSPSPARYNGNNHNAAPTPPKSRDVSPQNPMRAAQRGLGGAKQQQQQPAPSAYQERLRKAQAAAEAKQRKAEEDARAKEEADALREIERAKEAAAGAEREERMKKERKEREEQRSKALKEFMQLKKEGRREVLEHGGVQHEVHVAGERPMIIGQPSPQQQGQGGGGSSPPPVPAAGATPVPFAGRRAVGGGTPQAPTGGAQSARTPPDASASAAVIHFGRRQSPAPLSAAATPTTATNSASDVVQHVSGGRGAVAAPSPNQQRPASGPSAVQPVPTPTAPRGAVSVASLQQRGGAGAVGGQRGSAPPSSNNTPTAAAKRSPVRGGAGGGPAKAGGGAAAPTPQSASAAAEERRAKLRELREGMLAQIQRDRAANNANGNSETEIEIMLPGNLRHLPQNKI